MVLHGILEYFLHSTRAARRVYDAAIGDGEDGVLANAILEEFGDMRGKWC